LEKKPRKKAVSSILEMFLRGGSKIKERKNSVEAS